MTSLLKNPHILAIAQTARGTAERDERAPVFPTTWKERPVIASPCLDGLDIEGCTDETMLIMHRVLSRRMPISSTNEIAEPWGLEGMREAAEALAHAIMSQHTILIHGDYDVDGTTATALLWWFLTACTPARPPKAWIPDRRMNGYGMSEGSYEEVQQVNAQLLVTVDCGIVDGGMAERIEREQNCRVIITDHHLPGDALPNATGVVNPNQPGDTYANKALCGCGVAWQLARATTEILALREPAMAERAQLALERLLPLVSIATVADMVELTAENRAIIQLGLPHALKTQSRGLTTLCSMILGTGVIPTPEDVGWKIGPVLNAKGRLESARANVDLLIGTDRDAISKIATDLLTTNEERKRRSTLATENAMSYVSGLSDAETRQSYCIYLPDADEGVVGIVAGRVTEATGRPTIVCASGQQPGVLKGSMRTVPGVHCRQVIDACSKIIIRGGGHAAAAGLTLTEDAFPDLVVAVEKAVREQITAPIRGPIRHIDVIVDSCELGSDLWAAIESCGPWGQGHERPVIGVRELNLTSPGLALVGKRGIMLAGTAMLGDGTHVRVAGFGIPQSKRQALLGQTSIRNAKVKCAYNVFQGRRHLQLDILDGDPAHG